MMLSDPRSLSRTYFICAVLLFFLLSIASAQDQFSNLPSAAGGHRGGITALLPAEGGLALSAGKDGFLGIWDTKNMIALDRFQLSPWPVVSMAIRPGHTEIALIESDGLGLYRISAWNYREKKNLFKLRFRDPVSFITYSAGGSFLIVSRSGRTGTVFIDPATGTLLRSPENLTGIVSFAATGRSERSMIAYSPSGSLSYWDMESGTELRRLPVPANMESPVLFGTNRFFAGFDRQGLVVLDAASGTVLLRDENLRRGLLFSAEENISGTEAQFFCVSSDENETAVFHLAVNGSGTLEILSRGSLGQMPELTCALKLSAGEARTSGTQAESPSRRGRVNRITPLNRPLANANSNAASFLLGTADGRIYGVSGAGNAAAFVTGSQIPVRNASVSAGSLVFFTENGLSGTVNRDYTGLREGETLILESAGQYRFAAPAGAGADTQTGSFIFWQNENTQGFPLLKTSSGDPGKPLNTFSINFPLIAVSVLEKQALFLDSAGNITVGAIDTGRVLFSFSSAGSLDAAFLDDRNIIIGRSSVSGGTPFLKVNIRTGETVPLPYPAAVGLDFYRGESGAFYAAAIELKASPGTSGAAVTTIIALDANRPNLSRRLVEYQDEDSSFSFAESDGAFASTIGGDGASLYRDGDFYPFERSPGLPSLILSGGGAFITVDVEGNISWHSPQSGALLAILKIREPRWELELKNSGGATAISGPVDIRGPAP
jgi:hypothetical protein